MTKSKALGPDPLKLFTYIELPIGATAIGIPPERRKTGLWRYMRPAFQEMVPPCKEGCPLGNWIDRFIFGVNNKDLDQAWWALRLENPFPGVCGRVCYHPCQESCNRKDIDDAISIQAIERYLADHFFDKKSKPLRLRKRQGKKTAVVGSGPAGLSCAYFLALMGYDATVFEAQADPGGMMGQVIPRYRLPKEVLARDLENIWEAGVEIRTNTPIGKGLTVGGLQEAGYQALFISAGAPLSRKLDIEGVALDGVYWGLEFLREVNCGGSTGLNGDVVVIGGGNVAIDVALTALRLGADSVQIASLESRDEMPAHSWEQDDALEEGVSFHNGWAPKQILGENGSVAGIELKRCTSVFDKEGRFAPVYDEAVTKTLKAGAVIVAIGQATDLSFFEASNIRIDPGETIWVDPETLQTSVSGIFAGGDIIDQPRSVSEAIGSGKRAAIAMDHYLRGDDLRQIVQKGSLARTMREHLDLDGDSVSRSRKAAALDDLNLSYSNTLACRRPSKLSPVDRSGNFREIKLGMNPKEVNEEAMRCLSCGVCKMCGNCYLFCPDGAVQLDSGTGRYAIDYDYCKGCGVCQNECPAGAIVIEVEGEG
jgi:NADPH-dependent glutamate synthase beta subunit-like oxidoreductase